MSPIFLQMLWNMLQVPNVLGLDIPASSHAIDRSCQSDIMSFGQTTNRSPTRVHYQQTYGLGRPTEWALGEFCYAALSSGGKTRSGFNLCFSSGHWLITNPHFTASFPNAYVANRHLAQTPTVEADSKKKALLPRLTNHGPKVNERIFFFFF